MDRLAAALFVFFIMIMSSCPAFSADTTIKGTDTSAGTASLQVTNSSDASTLFASNGGTVGVGPGGTVPTANLEVVSDKDATDGLNTPSNYQLVLRNSNTGGGTGEAAGLGFHVSTGAGVAGAIAYEKVGNFGAGDMRFLTKLNDGNSGGIAERMRIMNSGNVGIGDTSPTSLLTVGSTDQFQVNSSGDIVKIDNVTYDWPAADASGVLTSNGSGALSWSSTGTGTAALSGISAATGNATIANGANNLVWNWALTGATEDGFIFGETSAATGGSGEQSVLKATALASSTAVPLMVTNLGAGLSFRVNDQSGGTDDGDTTPFVVDASGNVGVGTASPGAILDVASTNTATDPAVGTKYSTDISLANNQATNGNFARLTFRTVTGSGNDIAQAAVAAIFNDHSGGQATTDLVFYNNSGALVERMKIQGDTGNVGIGDTSPDQLLDLLSSSATSTQLTIDNASTGDPQIGFADGDDNVNTFTMGMDQSDSDKFKISTTALGTSDRLTIDSSGNVGIGTTTPAHPLTVSKPASGLTVFPQIVLENTDSTDGYVRLYADGDGAGGFLTFGGLVSTFSGVNGRPTHMTSDHGGRDSGIFNYQAATTDTTSRFVFGTANNGTGQAIDFHMTIERSGNVGIGDTSPDQLLDLLSSSATSTQLTIDNASTGDPQIGFADGDDNVNTFTMGMDQSDSDKFKISTTALGTSDRLVIDSSGNVGIGTSTMSGNLDVRQIADGGTAIYGRRNTDTSSTGNFINFQNAAANTNLFQVDTFGNIRGATLLNTSTSNNARIQMLTTGVVIDRNVAGSGTPLTVNRIADDGSIIDLQGASVTQGTISVSGTTVSYNAFTGSHYARLEFGTTAEEGMLVTLTGRNTKLHNDPDSETIYGISLSSQENDSRILGAYLGLLNPQSPRDQENPDLVMAVGNGEMWVVNAGEDIQTGDYLISSSVPGHARKAEPALGTNHVIARAAEPVRWDNAADVVGSDRKKISVFFESFAWEDIAALKEKLSRQQAEIDRLKTEVRSMQDKLKTL